MDYQSFFGRNSDAVAEDLVGRSLVRNCENKTIIAKILETGAYSGGDNGVARKGMNYAPGKIFLMPFRGHLMLNIATDKENEPSCVEIRKVSMDDKVIEGSARIANRLGIDARLDGIALGNELSISDDKDFSGNIVKSPGKSNNCSGYYHLHI